jgi:hypothetical protein
VKVAGRVGGGQVPFGLGEGGGNASGAQGRDDQSLLNFPGDSVIFRNKKAK